MGLTIEQIDAELKRRGVSAPAPSINRDLIDAELQRRGVTADALEPVAQELQPEPRKPLEQVTVMDPLDPRFGQPVPIAEQFGQEPDRSDEMDFGTIGAATGLERPLPPRTDTPDAPSLSA